MHVCGEHAGTFPYMTKVLVLHGIKIEIEPFPFLADAKGLAEQYPLIQGVSDVPVVTALCKRLTGHRIQPTG